MSLILLSFLAGMLTVLAPCILPFLPIIIGGGLKDGSKKGAFIITFSLSISVIVFTLLLRASTLLISVPLSFWTFVSGMLLLGFGIITLYPDLWAKFGMAKSLKDKAQTKMNTGYQSQSIGGDILVGAAMGPVFASCSPTYALILAMVLPIDFLYGVVNIVSYSFGLSFILLLIALLGQKFVKRIEGFANPQGKFKKGIGILFIAIGLFIITGIDKKVEGYFVDKGWIGITSIEENLLKKYKQENQ